MSLLPIVENGIPLLDVALTSTLYFSDGHTPRTRNGVIALAKEYAALCEGNLRHWYCSADADERVRYGAFDYQTISTVAATLQGAHAMAPWELGVGGGKEMEEATPFLMMCMGRGSWQQDMGQQGVVQFRLPWTWYATHESSFFDLFHRACTLLRPNYGFGGLGFAYSTDQDRRHRMIKDMYVIANAVPALVVEDFVFGSSELTKGIREGNWLTALSDAWLAKLGGGDEVARALGPDFTCRSFEGGMTIQAGAEPNPIGPSILKPAPPDPPAEPEDEIDHGVAQRDAASLYPLYHRLNQVLKPIRVSAADFKWGLQSNEYEKKDYFDHERTMRWMARFD